MSDSELELVATTVAGDLAVARRTDRDAPFGAPELLPRPPNTDANEAGASLSADGLELYFTGSINGQAPVVVSRRDTVEDAFGAPTGSGAFGDGDVSRDGLRHYGQDFGSNIRLFTRQSVDDTFVLGPDLSSVINSDAVDVRASISADELELYFESERGGFAHVWVATRVDRDAEFDTVAMVDIPEADHAPEISADGRRLYFMHEEAPAFEDEIWVASRCE